MTAHRKSSLSSLIHSWRATHTYTVSFETTLKDSSGGTLPRQVDLSFTTGDRLAGDVKLVGGNTYDGKQYTHEDSVTLYLQHNAQASPASPVHVHIAKSEAELSGGSPVNLDMVGPSTNYFEWPLDHLFQGTQMVYVEYFFGSQSSAIRSAEIVHDTEKPLVQPASLSSPYYNMYNATQNPPVRGAATATDATSGVYSYNWTGDPA